MKTLLLAICLLISAQVQAGALLSLGGWSKHDKTSKITYIKQNGYNETHSAVGFGYEIFDGEKVYSFGCITFINSFNNKSNGCGGTYKKKTHSFLYLGVKSGLVSGYGPRDRTLDNGEEVTINPNQPENLFYILPTFSLKNNMGELELSYAPKISVDTVSAFMLSFKINI